MGLEAANRINKVFHSQQVRVKEGKVAETKLLGDCVLKKRNDETDEEYKKRREDFAAYKERHLTFADVKDNQPDKLPDFARYLEDAVLYDLYPDEDEDSDKVKVYTAIGSALDHWHGIDGFVEINDKYFNKRITFDITLEGQKEQPKADLVINIPRDGINIKKDRGEFMKQVNKAAEDIASFVRVR